MAKGRNVIRGVYRANGISRSRGQNDMKFHRQSVVATSYEFDFFFSPTRRYNIKFSSTDT